MRFIFFMAALFGSSAAMADFRQVEATNEMMQELQRRCEVHAKNDRKPFQLVIGHVIQTGFKAPNLEPCEPSEEKVCPRRNWFPTEFKGIMTHTNRYEARQQVYFSTQGFHENDIQDLNFVIGKYYAFCATETKRRHPKMKPRFVIHNFFTIYELTPANS